MTQFNIWGKYEERLDFIIQSFFVLKNTQL